MYVTNFGGVQGLLASIMPDQKYPASKGVCYIRFWYYMHTSHQVAENVDLGTLRVYLEGKFLHFHFIYEELMEKEVSIAG